MDKSMLQKTKQAWRSTVQRCENPNRKDYKYYGGRGISVCERWHKFENFFEDMGIRPKQNLTLERIDNDGNYKPGNCCWVTRKKQNGNTCKQKFFIAFGPYGQIKVAKNQHAFARFWNLRQAHINHCLSNQHKTHQGWEFEYLILTNT
jgi:hypothetical protein